MNMSLVTKLTDRMIHYFAGDAKRISHFQKVHSYAKLIGELENIDSNKLEILELAAIVHDVGIKISEKKYNSSAGKYQELEGPPIAEELLKELNVPESTINRVSFLVGHHHTYLAIDEIDFQILVEADFLVNIFEEGMTQAQAVKIRDKYFRTFTGIDYINSIFDIHF